MDGHSTFRLQIVLTPHVVIACKEMHFHAHVRQFAHLAQKSGVAFRHHFLVLKPEVEDVAKQKDGFGLVLDGVEEIDKTALAGATVFHRTAAQMGIGYEIVVLHNWLVVLWVKVKCVV